MEIKCSQNCNIVYLSELYVCKEPTCSLPQLRCQNCYRYIHVNVEQNGVKKPHVFEKFDESYLYKNFLYLTKLTDVIERRMKKNFGEYSDHVQYLSNIVFFMSTEIQQIFTNDELYQFQVLRQIYYKRQASFVESPTLQFQKSLQAFSEKKYEKVIEKITKSSYQELVLEQTIIYACGNKGLDVESFIIGEQQFFMAYCQDLREKGEGLNIISYLSERRKQLGGNEVYYSRDYQNFMEDKYEKKPQEKDLFTLAEYSQYMWLHLTLHFADINIKQYFNGWVNAYEQYLKLFQGKSEELSIVTFRIWKQQNFPYTGVFLKNLYFLETFILGFVQHLIHHANYGIGQPKVKSWDQYGLYMKDFIEYMKQKQIQFVDMYEYRQYYNFRNEHAHDFYEKIRTSPDIVFNKAYAAEYMNKVYKENGQISLKAYKKYLATKNEEETAKMTKKNEASSQLMQKMQVEEGDRFYATIFNGFVIVAEKEEIQLNRENYLEYKGKVLEKFDEKAIRMENQELEESQKILSEQIQGEMGETFSKPKEGKVEYEIDVAEKFVHLAIEDSSDEGQMVQGEIDCPCCKGNPDRCDVQECQMMGYCVTCSL